MQRKRIKEVSILLIAQLQEKYTCFFPQHFVIFYIEIILGWYRHDQPKFQLFNKLYKLPFQSPVVIDEKCDIII